MIDFLKESEHFSGVSFSGFFNIDLDDLKVLHDHYKQTGENLLDDYCTVIHLGWDLDNRDQMMNNEILNDNLQSISKVRRLGIFRAEYIHSLQNYCRRCYKRLQDKRERQLSRERRDACIYTSKENVRQWVFTVHGEKCLNCGTTDDITIDHIKPISRGGKNRLSNLQPLCKSCNSSKGTQTIDYRNNGTELV